MSSHPGRTEALRKLIQHDKAGIVDLDTGEVKFFKSGYLGRVF